MLPEGLFKTPFRITDKIAVATESNKGWFLEILEITTDFIVDKYILA